MTAEEIVGLTTLGNNIALQWAMVARGGPVPGMETLPGASVTVSRTTPTTATIEASPVAVGVVVIIAIAVVVAMVSRR